MFRSAYVCVGLLTLVAATALSACGKPSGASGRSSSAPNAHDAQYDPQMYSKMRAYGFLWTEAHSPTAADGRPRVYPVSQLGKPGVPELDDAMIAQVHDVTAQLEPRYRPFLSFALIDEFPQYRYLAVFLTGHPQYPAVNLCYPTPDCTHDCPRYFDPIARIVHVSTMPACADALPIWSKR